MSFDLKAFKKDLKVLLKEHGATLGVNLTGDTHGLITDFVVTDRAKNKDHILNAGYDYLDVSDLE